ncbi:hypothetical protein MLD38_025652 [Melastoma candidum]|uniref:Uncharacterized protein n=1 Tax=Melastoma candidum TaxID=119954 RepID=A0ACB9NX03_9MYRT|nr:hypothetical protein MLD38_025652 [Melastoma candidum]
MFTISQGDFGGAAISLVKFRFELNVSSDWHFLELLGTECAGVIEKVGNDVKSLVPVDRVALEPGISYWRCDYSKEGLYNLCPDMKFLATPVHVSLANQAVHPADLCFKLPYNVSLEEGAICEPLRVGIHACCRANKRPAPKVIMQMWMISGSVTKSLGANSVVKVSRSIQDADEEVLLIQKAVDALIDVTFDCAGFDKAMSTALSATRADGKVCLVGMGHNEMTVQLNPTAASVDLFWCREDDVIGIFCYKTTWSLCLEFIRSGKIYVKLLITHRFGFSQKEVEDAFETSARLGDAKGDVQPMR